MLLINSNFLSICVAHFFCSLCLAFLLLFVFCVFDLSFFVCLFAFLSVHWRQYTPNRHFFIHVYKTADEFGRFLTVFPF